MGNFNTNLLKPNATIGFLTASSPIENIEKIEKAKKYFTDKGYNVVISDSTYKSIGNLFIPEDIRLQEMYSFFENPDIDIILCTRGGYGALKLINKIDYNFIKKHAKPFCGYSDATAYLLSFYKHTGMITYHSPMPCSDFCFENIPELTQKSFFDVLQGNINSIELNKDALVYNSGVGEGVLWGGNLATIASMVGFDFVPDEKFIFFVEDIDEPAYKIDRYFTMLLNIPEFKKNLAGIVVGELTNTDLDEFKQYMDNLIVSGLDVPIIKGLQIGHVRETLTLPVGVDCKLDTNDKKLLVRRILCRLE